MQIDTAAALTQFAGTLPTFIAVILAWMHSNARISDLNSRIDDTTIRIDARITDLNNRMDKRFDDLRDLIRADIRRVEEVMDARLKHLEEHFH